MASAGRVRAEVPKEGSNVRTYELTADGYFAGVDGGGVLVARKKDWKVFRVSRRHARVHEGTCTAEKLFVEVHKSKKMSRGERKSIDGMSISLAFSMSMSPYAPLPSFLDFQFQCLKMK